jgi:hypothetical protein
MQLLAYDIYWRLNSRFEVRHRSDDALKLWRVSPLERGKFVTPGSTGCPSESSRPSNFKFCSGTGYGSRNIPTAGLHVSPRADAIALESGVNLDNLGFNGNFPELHKESHVVAHMTAAPHVDNCTKNNNLALSNSLTSLYGNTGLDGLE